MSRDLTLRGTGARLVAEGDRPEADLVLRFARQQGRRRRIVIARDPDPVAARLQRAQRGAIFLAHARSCVTIMK